MSGGLTLLLTSPRVAGGLLTWPAWQALAQADLVLARDVQHEQAAALDEAAIPWQCSEFDQPRDIARQLVDRARAGRSSGSARPTAIRGSPTPSPPSSRGWPWTRIRRRSRCWSAATTSPGARLLDLVAVMDRLRSPGGCPWDAAQTHESLTPYLLEEAYEAVEAVESGDRSALAEELGDVLLQVVFHARLAQEDPQEPFDIDDVAAGIVAKLVRRHPHVFAVPGGPEPSRTRSTTPEHVEANWDRIKTAEKGRQSVLDGIPVALPALARADAVLGRLDRAGLAADVRPDSLTSSGAGTKRAWVARCSLWWSRRAAQAVDAEAALRGRRAPSRGRRPRGPSSARGPDERLRRGRPATRSAATARPSPGSWTRCSRPTRSGPASSATTATTRSCRTSRVGGRAGPHEHAR